MLQKRITIFNPAIDTDINRWLEKKYKANDDFELIDVKYSGATHDKALVIYEDDETELEDE